MIRQREASGRSTVAQCASAVDAHSWAGGPLADFQEVENLPTLSHALVVFNQSNIGLMFYSIVLLSYRGFVTGIRHRRSRRRR